MKEEQDEVDGQTILSFQSASDLEEFVMQEQKKQGTTNRLKKTRDFRQIKGWQDKFSTEEDCNLKAAGDETSESCEAFETEVELESERTSHKASTAGQENTEEEPPEVLLTELAVETEVKEEDLEEKEEDRSCEGIAGVLCEVSLGVEEVEPKTESQPAVLTAPSTPKESGTRTRSATPGKRTKGGQLITAVAAQFAVSALFSPEVQLMEVSSSSAAASKVKPQPRPTTPVSDMARRKPPPRCVPSSPKMTLRPVDSQLDDLEDCIPNNKPATFDDSNPVEEPYQDHYGEWHTLSSTKLKKKTQTN